MSWTNSLSVDTYVNSLPHCTPRTGGSRVSRGCPHTVNPAITVLVSFPDHLVNFVIGKLLANRGHDMAQLCGRNEAVVIAIEDLKRFPDLLLGIGVLHLPCHHGQEFCCGRFVNYPATPLLLSGYVSHTRKVDCAIVVSINFVNHVLQLRLRGVLAEGAHHSAQLLGGDLACNLD